MLLQRERPEDIPATDAMIRDAFRNLYVPGATEYLPAYRMRSLPDFVPELDCIAEIDQQIVRSNLYTKVKLIAEDGSKCDCLSFGLIAVHPDFQRRGIGRALIETTFEKARKMGHQCIVIFGHPSNYAAGGFVSCKKMNMCPANVCFSTALLVKALTDDAFDGSRLFFQGTLSPLRWNFISIPTPSLQNDKDPFCIQMLFEARKSTEGLSAPRRLLSIQTCVYALSCARQTTSAHN